MRLVEAPVVHTVAPASTTGGTVPRGEVAVNPDQVILQMEVAPLAFEDTVGVLPPSHPTRKPAEEVGVVELAEPEPMPTPEGQVPQSTAVMGDQALHLS